MICWWLGVVLAEVVAGRIKVRLLVLAIASFSAYGFLFLINRDAKIYDLQIAFLFASFLALFLQWNEDGKSLKLLERIKPFGDFSYTLYITHFPILAIFAGCVMKNSGNLLPQHPFFIVAGSIISLLAAYLLHFIVERPFMSGTKKKSTRANMIGRIRTIRLRLNVKQ